MKKNINNMHNQEKEKTDWEKIGIYIACAVAFLTILFYVVEMKVDIAKLQVNVEHLQEKK